MTAATVRVRRIYDPARPTDGARVLVDRLWPRGISKERADLTEWLKTVAPSTALREWYGHDPAKFEEFSARYRAELAADPQKTAFAELQSLVAQGPVTLLTASKAVEISEATVLQSLVSHE